MPDFVQMFDMTNWLNDYRALYQDIQWQSQFSVMEHCEGEIAWLQDSTSLSKKLETYCSQLSVDVLSNQLTTQDENCSSSMSSHWLREVLLLGDNSHWVYAQSHVEQQALEQPVIRQLMHDDKPLGLALFSTQQVMRDQMQIGQVTLDNQRLWARRSRLLVKDHSIWVSELFLPNAPIYHLQPGS
jgi:chorismate--pyruvate lyase